MNFTERISMRERVFLVILWLFFLFFRLSGENIFLTDEDAGLLLYSTYKDGQTIKSGVLVFRKVIRENNGSCLLECTPFHGDGSIHQVKPCDCLNLKYTESELTPETVAMELAYWNSRSGREAKRLSGGYLKLAERMNVPVTNLVISFYKDLDKYGESVKRDIAQYHAAKAGKKEQTKKQPPSSRNRCPFSMHNPSPGSDSDTLAMVLEKGLKYTLKNTNAIRVIQNLSDNQKNYFLAFCLYSRYWDISKTAIRRSGISHELKKELIDEILQVGEEIREKYVRNRNYNQNREKSFKTVLPDRHGKWEYAPPSNLQEMDRSFIQSCYAAWRKTLTLSPHTEFPEWGNAMLEVLQMIRNPAWENQFDTAFSEYQKYNSN